MGAMRAPRGRHTRASTTWATQHRGNPSLRLPQVRFDRASGAPGCLQGGGKRRSKHETAVWEAAQHGNVKILAYLIQVRGDLSLLALAEPSIRQKWREINLEITGKLRANCGQLR